MENILMVFCRRQKQYSSEMVAAKLGVPTEIYDEIEKGKVLINEKQARALGRLYHADFSYFYDAALQLDLLQTRTALLRALKVENDLLKWEVGEPA